MEKPSLLRRKSLSLKGTLTRLLGSEQQQQEPEQAEQGPKSPLVASSPPQLPELQLNTPPPPATSPALSSASSGSIREVTAVLKDDPCDVAMADDGFSVDIEGKDNASRFKAQLQVERSIEAAGGKIIGFPFRPFGFNVDFRGATSKFPFRDLDRTPSDETVVIRPWQPPAAEPKAPQFNPLRLNPVNRSDLAASKPPTSETKPDSNDEDEDSDEAPSTPRGYGTRPLSTIDELSEDSRSSMHGQSEQPEKPPTPPAKDAEYLPKQTIGKKPATNQDGGIPPQYAGNEVDKTHQPKEVDSQKSDQGANTAKSTASMFLTVPQTEHCPGAGSPAGPLERSESNTSQMEFSADEEMYIMGADSDFDRSVSSYSLVRSRSPVPSPDLPVRDPYQEELPTDDDKASSKKALRVLGQDSPASSPMSSSAHSSPDVMPRGSDKPLPAKPKFGIGNTWKKLNKAKQDRDTGSGNQQSAKTGHSTLSPPGNGNSTKS